MFIHDIEKIVCIRLLEIVPRRELESFFFAFLLGPGTSCFTIYVAGAIWLILVL
jgi:hypothetical protein